MGPDPFLAVEEAEQKAASALDQWFHEQVDAAGALVKQLVSELRATRLELARRGLLFDIDEGGFLWRTESSYNRQVRAFRMPRVALRFRREKNYVLVAPRKTSSYELGEYRTEMLPPELCVTLDDGSFRGNKNAAWWALPLKSYGPDVESFTQGIARRILETGSLPFPKGR